MKKVLKNLDSTGVYFRVFQICKKIEKKYKHFMDNKDYYRVFVLITAFVYAVVIYWKRKKG